MGGIQRTCPYRGGKGILEITPWKSWGYDGYDKGRRPLFSLGCADSCGEARFARTRIEGRKWEKVGRLERYWARGKILYSSTITIRERNIKTPAQNREKRDKCEGNGEREGREEGAEGKGEKASAAANAAAKAARVTRRRNKN